MGEVIRGASVAPGTENLVLKRTPAALQAYMKEWTAKTRERVDRGEPLVVGEVMTPHELFEAMDIPWVLGVFLDWYYPDLVSGRLADQNPIIPREENESLGRCGRCGNMLSQLSRLPRLSAIVGYEGECSGSLKAATLWARRYNIPMFMLEATASAPFYGRYPKWWERIEDHWDELIEPHRLDYRTEELKSLVKFLEVTTGKTLSETRLREVMEAVNQQQEYWRKARDLIATTRPAPVGVYDTLYTYTAQWHRGTPEGRDIARVFYEEVKERVERGQAVCPGEKLRLQWVKTAYYTNPGFYKYFEEKYGAVFVCSWYLSPGADCYARKVIDDPLRALAGRHVFLGIYAGPEWDIKEGRLHGVQGAVMMSANCPSGGVARKMHKLAYEAAGIPMCLVDSSWDAEKIKDEVARFIETRLLPASR